MPYSIRIFPIATAIWLMLPMLGPAQTNLSIYSDSLANDWLDYSYSVTRSFSNPSPVHSGSASINATITNQWGAVFLYHAPMTNSAYASVSFWINGGPGGGQQLWIYGNLGPGYNAQAPHYALNILAPNLWQQYVVPLSFLGVANATNFSGFAIQDAVGSAQPTFYLDDIQLVSAVTPAQAHLTVNPGQTVRTADARWFGINGGVWVNEWDSPNTINQLSAMGTRALRIPGGSLSDEYHWATDRSLANTWTWVTSLANFIHVITNVNVQQVMATANYGTGSTNEAAAWVAYANAASANTQPLGTDAAGTNWQTAGYWASLRAATPLGTDDGRNFLRLGHPAPFAFKYWEIGNEVYGTWETDSNSLPHDPYTYALRARDYIALMKAVDPAIKIGVVVTPGEDSSANYTTHPATNSRTGLAHNSWTPVLLATLKTLGVTPDFLVHHRYPQYPGSENDAALLQSSIGWVNDAGNLRQQLSDYLGTAGTNVELLCTENNSVTGSPGKQTTSLVSGLFLCDSLGQMMQTEFNGLFWWDLHEGGLATNNNSSSLYGWRMYGTYGVTEGTNYFPTYYTTRLMQKLVQPGDTVVSAGSDYHLLAAYAVRRQDGAVTLLAINKDPVNVITGLVAVAGFTPAASATVYSYGIPQDNAARTGLGSPDITTNYSVVATNFTNAFAPYSATVFSLVPAPARLSPLGINPSRFILQLQGQAGIPYVLQVSTNLFNWSDFSTNIPAAGTLNLTNYFTNSPAPHATAQFWRAVWLP